MKIVSAFPNEGIIPRQYTCDGENMSPPFTISDIPEGAKSLALIVDDPDAPHGTWIHWLVWNIPANIDSIPEGVIPEGSIEGATSFGKPGWGGPCPPSGIHRYFFRLYALDVSVLVLSPESQVDDLQQAMNGHVIEKTELMGRYGRPVK